MPDPRDSTSPFGITADVSEQPERTVALLQDAGAGIVRLEFPLVASVRHDEAVALLSTRGIKILGLLREPSAPSIESLPAFLSGVTQTVHRFKDRVRHWEFWNEPDDERFWQPQDEMRTYTDFLKKTAGAIKTEDASAVVHMGGLGRGLPKSLKNIYLHGGRDFFDVVHMHPFLNPLMPDAAGGLKYFHDMVYKTLRENRDDAKPIWYSRIGCPGMSDPKQTADWWLGKNPTEGVQADWVRLLYQKALGWPGVEKILWAALRDTPQRANDGTDFMGLVRTDFTPKPAFDAYRHAHQSLGLSGSHFGPPVPFHSR